MKRHKGMLVPTVIIAVLILLVLSGCDANTDSGSTAPMAATVMPTATATPKPVVVGPTVLGGNEQAFISKYGTPDNRSDLSIGDLRFISPDNPSPDGLQVQLDIADGAPYNQRAELITALPPNENSGGTWDSATAHSICGSFIPHDATKKKTLTLLDGEGKVNGDDEVYFSPWLAQQFPASSFEDGKQNQVQPGLFDITYYYEINTDDDNYDSNQITYCELAIGTTGDAFAG